MKRREVAVFSNAQTPTQQVKKNERTGKYILKKKNKNKNTNEMKMYNLFDREFKITIIKMLNEDRRTIHEQSEIFNKEVENIFLIKHKFSSWIIQ